MKGEATEDIYLASSLKADLCRNCTLDCEEAIDEAFEAETSNHTCQHVRLLSSYYDNNLDRQQCLTRSLRVGPSETKHLSENTPLGAQQRVSQAAMSRDPYLDVKRYNPSS